MSEGCFSCSLTHTRTNTLRLLVQQRTTHGAHPQLGFHSTNQQLRTCLIRYCTGSTCSMSLHSFCWEVQNNGCFACCSRETKTAIDGSGGTHTTLRARPRACSFLLPPYIPTHTLILTSSYVRTTIFLLYKAPPIKRQNECCKSYRVVLIWDCESGIVLL